MKLTIYKIKKILQNIKVNNFTEIFLNSKKLETMYVSSEKVHHNCLHFLLITVTIFAISSASGIYRTVKLVVMKSS